MFSKKSGTDACDIQHVRTGCHALYVYQWYRAHASATETADDRGRNDLQVSWLSEKEIRNGCFPCHFPLTSMAMSIRVEDQEEFLFSRVDNASSKARQNVPALCAAIAYRYKILSTFTEKIRGRFGGEPFLAGFCATACLFFSG